MAPRPLPIARTGAAAALVAWYLLARHGAPAPPSPPPPVPAPAPAHAPAPVWVVDVQDTPEGRAMLGKELVVPSVPLEGQARPPCPEGYVVLGGACWVKTDKTAPCPPTMWRSGTACYLPLRKSSTNTSIDR